MQNLRNGKYKELNVVGRGNFGTAMLVLNNEDQRQYIAKKIILGALNQAEQKQAQAEADLLKMLDHPNIVHYIESFIEDGILVIIMEYCEVGDLSYHVKKKKQNQEFFTEAEILNWFVQMLLALQYIHSKKILHRDMKSSNVYLTSNNTVKIGDFGISKVLENTQEVAMTVVGTPYYMSPEVCESKPYTYKSDIWALGCILYELCMLKHAFSADNLLGLVYKIVKEKIEQIPNHYSQELQELINVMLIKDFNQRPSIAQILQIPYVMQSMQFFVNTGGNSISKTHKIRKMPTFSQTQAAQLNQSQQAQQFSQSVAVAQKQIPPNETPKQRLAREKQERAEAERQKLMQYQQQSLQDKQFAQQRKENQLRSSFGFNQQRQQQKQQIQVQQQQYSQQPQYQQQQMYQQQQPQQRMYQQPIQQVPQQQSYQYNQYQPNYQQPQYAQQNSVNKFINQPVTQMTSLNKESLSYWQEVDQEVDRMMEGSGVDFTLSSNPGMGQTQKEFQEDKGFNNQFQNSYGLQSTVDTLPQISSMNQPQLQNYNSMEDRAISSKGFYQLPSDEEEQIYEDDFEDVTAEPNNEELLKVIQIYKG